MPTKDETYGVPPQWTDTPTRTRKAYNAEDVNDVMTNLFDRVDDLRIAGNQDYAHSDETPFRNFEAMAEDANIKVGQAWLVLTRKHWDGIVAYIRGRSSMREHVLGRIADLILYLVLLAARIMQDEGRDPKEVWWNPEAEAQRLEP